MRPTAPAAPTDVAADTPPPPRPRQCGRCRLVFDGDPTLHPVALPDWWLCPPCRATLVGGPAPTTGPPGAAPPEG